MKINVTGNAGSGKSTLSKFLAQELGFPLIEMDKIVWDPGWRRVGRAEREARLQPLLDQESWVLDGVSRTAREQADLVVFLDLPLWLCLFRCLRRSWQHRKGQRPGLPENCPEWRIVFPMLRILLNFPLRARPAIMRDLKTGRGLVLQSSPTPEERAELRRRLESPAP